MATKVLSSGNSPGLVPYSLIAQGPSHMVRFPFNSDSSPDRGRCSRRTQGPGKTARKLLTIDSSLDLGRCSLKGNLRDYRTASHRWLSNMHRQTSSRGYNRQVASKASRAAPSLVSSQLPTRNVLKVQWLLAPRALYRARPKTHSMVLDSMSNSPCHKHHSLSSTLVNRELSRVY